MTERFSDISQVEEYLGRIPKFSQTGAAAANFDLTRMVRMCERMGNPQERFPAIHVAGTNGKGTVCQMLASVYQHAGFKTGLYTSPHLIRFHERFRINGRDIDDDSLLSFFNRYESLISEEKATYFELSTAIAFWYFGTEEVDIAIIETGLGGRLDATNVITPVASVITSIGRDHTDLLGDALGEIASEKAGIIKKNIPVFTGNLPGSAKKVLAAKAEEQYSPLLSVSKVQPEFRNLKICLRSESGPRLFRASNRKKIDAINVGIVFLVADYLNDRFPVSDSQFTDGIEQTDTIFPEHGHFEKLSSEKNWYFDGAHNPEAIRILADEMLSRAPAGEWLVVLSFMKDKLTQEVGEIWNAFPNLRVYQQTDARAASAEDMKLIFPGALEFDEALFTEKGFDRKKSELVIFSGSFYFYNKVRRWMGTIAAKNI